MSDITTYLFSKAIYKRKRLFEDYIGLLKTHFKI